MTTIFNRKYFLLLIFSIFFALFSGHNSFQGSGDSIVVQALTGNIVFSADHFGGYGSNLYHFKNSKAENGEPAFWNPYYGLGRTLYADGFNMDILTH